MSAAPINRRVQNEVAGLAKLNMQDNGIELVGHVDNLETITVRFKMPANCYLQNSIFMLEVKFPENYPFKPPHVQFLGPPPLHVNISSASGYICMSTLKEGADGWNPAWRIQSFIPALISVLLDPNYDDPLYSIVWGIFHADETRGKTIATLWSHLLHGCDLEVDAVLLKMVETVTKMGISERAALYSLVNVDFVSAEEGIKDYTERQ